MISLRYLRENNSKLRESKRKLASKTVHGPIPGLFKVCVPPAQESAPGNVKAGRDLHEYCTPYTDSVFVVRSDTGV